MRPKLEAWHPGKEAKGNKKVKANQQDSSQPLTRSSGSLQYKTKQVGLRLKRLTALIRRSGGRNNHGCITVRHRRSGAKKAFRVINNHYSLVEKTGTVCGLVHDPHRSVNVALMQYRAFGVLCYKILPRGLGYGDKLRIKRHFRRGSRYKKLTGFSYPLQALPTSIPIFNVELKPGHGGQAARSAGARARIVRKISYRIQHRRKPIIFIGLGFPSGKTSFVLGSCYGTIGEASNRRHIRINWMLAGTSYHKGWRPSVRGVAMNPIDHPHGGGEGKTSGGRPSVSPWGRITKGGRTISRKRRLAGVRFLERMRRRKRKSRQQ